MLRGRDYLPFRSCGRNAFDQNLPGDENRYLYLNVLEQLDFFLSRWRPKAPDEDFLRLGSRTVPLLFIRKDTARRYILRLADDGSARVTVPRRGSVRAAREFVQRHLGWLEKQLQKREARPTRPAAWADGTEILFRGEPSRVEVEAGGRTVRLADQTISVPENGGDLRPPIERHLRKLAASELVPRTFELASLHQLTVGRVTVRDQRSRWGSCSVKRTIALNWRLIQTPALVRDYIIVHELMHLREMNHSRRFWQQVERVFPDYAEAERWLKQHGGMLRLE